MTATKKITIHKKSNKEKDNNKNKIEEVKQITLYAEADKKITYMI